MVKEYLSLIKAGQIQRNVFNELLKDLPEYEGKRVVIRISPLTTRTNRQNSYLHALFTIFSKELIDYTGDTSYTKDLVKSMAKTKYLLKRQVNEETGEVIGEYVQETHKLNKEEFTVFTKQVIGWAADAFGIHLPLPGESEQFDY